MKLNHDNNAAVSTGAERSGTFGIANNGKAFKVLSDSIYQDKIGSMIRETACNGLDSHIQNGNPDTPIQIHMPDAFEPWYSVEDFGLGMSPDTIDNVFTVYFSSTKAQSNDVIGAFGLGAKTPFAYTDKFTVTSTHNGKRYLYAMYYNDNNEPQSDLMDTSDVPEGTPNGVKIEVPVLPEHFREFREALKNQLRFFAVKPIILNGGQFEFDATPRALLETKSVTVLDTAGMSSYSDLRKSFIVQGPVGYAIDESLLMRRMEEALDQDLVPGLTRKNLEFLRVMLRTATWFKFDIGEVGVTASREGVEYTKHTIKNFATKLITIHKEMIDYVESSLTGAKNAYERVKLLNRMTSFRNLIQHIEIDIGNAKKDRYEEHYSFHFSDAPIFKTVAKNAQGNVTHSVNNFQITAYERAMGGSLKTSRMTDITLTPDDNDNIVIILRDTNSRPILRLRQYFETNTNEKRVIVVATTGAMTIFDGGAVKNAVIDAFGGFDGLNVINLSDCPEPPAGSSVRNRAAYTRPTGYVMPKHSFALDSIAKWNRVFEEPDDPEFGMGDDGVEVETALYVLVDRQRVQTQVDTRLFNALKEEGMLDSIGIYGFRIADEAKLQSSGINWISLPDFLAAKREEIAKDKKIKRSAYATIASDHVKRKVNVSLLELEESKLDSKSELHSLRKILNESDKIVNSNGVSHRMLEIAGHKLPKTFLQKIDRLSSSFAGKNPFISKLLPYHYSRLEERDIEHAVDYINWNASK